LEDLETSLAKEVKYHVPMIPRVFPTGEEAFNRWLIEEYFKRGSVDEVLKKYRFSLPVSYANYQRILNRWGVIKKAGPDIKLTEALDFLSHLANETASLEKLYLKMPPSFQTSLSTLHRIMSYVKDGITRRVGCALIITPYNDPDRILIGKDVSTPRIELGKPFGSLSLPMGYARKRDSRVVAVTRVLQQEVFTKKVIENTFSNEFLTEDLEPFLYLDVADIRVSVYHLELSQRLSNLKQFSSYKLTDFQYFTVKEVLSDNNNLFRVGVKEAVGKYQKHLMLLSRNLKANPLQEKSGVNKSLAVLDLEIEY
jgi:hypothetical protein